jgi:hypothetical protein
MIPDVNVLCSLMKHLIFRPLNQIASLADSETAIYSASVVDKATVACKRAFQLTAQCDAPGF